MTAPAWTQTHLPAHAATWWQANADAMSDAAQALADQDDTELYIDGRPT